MGGVAVPKTVQKPPLPREDGPEVPVDRGPMSKTVQKSRSPRRDATDVLLSLVAAPKEGR